jgi:hypothetical protein
LKTYLDGEPPSLPQVTGRWQQTLEAIETACGLLKTAPIDDPYYFTYADWVADEATYNAMTLAVARLEKRIAGLRARPSRRAKNARNAHNDYWRELTQVWLAVTKGKISRHGRRHLSRFLDACTAPILAELFEQDPADVGRRLETFIGNFFRSSPQDL